MTIETGLKENIKLEDDSNTEVQDLFGSYASASAVIDESSRREGTIGNEGKAAEVADGPVENSAVIECKPESLEILKLMGTFDSGAGTITFPADLPKHNLLQAQFTDSHSFKFEDFKVGGFTLSCTLDESVFIEFSPILAETGSIPKTTVDVDAVTGQALQWTDSTVKINGSQFGVTESVESSLDRNISSEYGLGSGREPEEIVEGEFNIEISLVVKVEDASPYEELLDDSSFPLTVSESRGNVSEISIDFGDGNGELVVKKGKAEINEFEFDEEKDVRTVELSFPAAQDVEVRNL
jgi:hypothetical protein